VAGYFGLELVHFLRRTAIAVTATAGQALVRSYIPWFLIGLLVALWLRYGPWPDRRR